MPNTAYTHFILDGLQRAQIERNEVYQWHRAFFPIRHTKLIKIRRTSLHNNRRKYLTLLHI